jgi:hypothetical protein
MFDDRNNYNGPRYDAMGRLLPEREKETTTWEAEQVYHSDVLNQDFTNPLVMADEERKELLRRRTPSKEELALEAAPKDGPDGWDQYLRQKARQEYAADTAPARSEIGDTFVLAHPEFKDCTPNAKKLLAKISERKDILEATIDDYEQAYRTLVGRGEIELNQAVLNKQNRERIQAAAQRHREEITFDRETAESLPMDELLRRCGGRGR